MKVNIPTQTKRGFEWGTRNILEDVMEGWKKALVVGTLGAGAVLVMTRRRPAGAVFAAAGLALLASEYPEKFEALWENAPEYMNRATQILGVIAKISERFAEAAERRSSEEWHSLQEEYGS